MIKDDYWFIECKEDVDNLKCPFCSNKLTFPLTGSVTAEQIEEDEKNCHLIECVDEHDMNLGYHIICKREGIRC